MEKERIRRAYDALAPDEKTRRQMLAAVVDAASGRREIQKRPRLRRLVCVAAILALCLLFAAAAYAVCVMDLSALVLLDQPAAAPLSPVPLETAAGQPALEATASVPAADEISLQGFSGSPEYQACQQWQTFRARYDPDGAILARIGNGETGLPPQYAAYDCYTREMADELDALCSRYDLALLGESTVETDLNRLLACCGIETLFAKNDAAAQAACSGYWYPDGTFRFEGETVLTDPAVDWPYPVSYQFSRVMKGTLDTATLGIGAVDAYVSWSFQTTQGIWTLLALSDSKALVVVERPESFIVVHILNPRVGDVVLGERTIGARALETFAQSFDFSAIP